MRRIYGIGETVLDIIFKDSQPQAAKAGGSMLNSVVSLGRIGLPVWFISEYGKDDVGNLVDHFLNENSVNTDLVHKFEDGNTALALAFLDQKNDANYSFYKNYPTKRLDVVFPEVTGDDIVLCGSFYSIWTEVRPRFLEFINNAKNNGALIIYDPNFRKSHLFELDRLKPIIIENMSLASLIRGSNEDFNHIFGCNTIDEAYRKVGTLCPNLVYTANIHGVEVKTPGSHYNFPVQKIQAVSTIGAGDNFNAGMIAAIFKLGLRSEQLSHLLEQEWELIITTAVEFASEVCLSYENYISSDFAKAYSSR
jgi:fructokinase